jgi:hypothetical protein
MVVATATVGGEELQSRPMTIGSTGYRVMLVAGSTPAGSDGATAAAPVSGSVVIGPASRVVLDSVDEALNVYYLVQIVNAAAGPVDIGGPVLFDLPEGARRATALEGSSPAATVNGARVTVLGPFPPGVTEVRVGFELPGDRPTARLEQRWPVPLHGFTLFAMKTGEVDVTSPHIKNKRTVVQEGQPLITAEGVALPAGATLVLDVSGLPHHPRWPTYLALALAGLIAALGVWAAATRPRRGWVAPRAA